MTKRHLLIVGGSRGLGAVLAHRAADRYERISMIARTGFESPSDAATAPVVESYAADLSNPPSVENAMKRVVADGGAIHHLAFAQRNRGGDSGSEWRTNVTATREIVDLFAESSQDGGAIVVMNSIAARQVADEQPLDYHLARAALEQLVRYYAVTLGPSGIRINGVSSGPFVKPGIPSREYLANESLVELHRVVSPLGRLPRAAEIANVLLFLLGDDASFVNGQHLLVDGGISLRGHEALARRVADSTRNHDDP